MKQLPVTGRARDIGSRGIKDINKQVMRMSQAKRQEGVEIFRVVDATTGERRRPKHTGNGRGAWYLRDLEEAATVKTVMRMGSERGEQGPKRPHRMWRDQFTRLPP